MLDLAAITPSLEILSAFQTAVDTNEPRKLSKERDHKTENNDTLMTNFKERIMLSICEIEHPHELFAFITPENRPRVWKELLGVAEAVNEYERLREVRFYPLLLEYCFPVPIQLIPNTHALFIFSI